LFGRHRGPETFDVALLDLETGRTRVLIPDAFDARFVPTGHVVFARGESLLAVPFDVQRLEVSGAPVVMVERILTTRTDGAANYGIANDGLLAYIAPIDRESRQLAWLSESGAIEPLPISPGGFNRPTLSPDGTRIAVQVSEGARRDIRVYDIGSGVTSAFTSDGASENPIWTPDSQRLTFSTTKDGRREIYWRPADGTQPAERLVADTYSVFPSSWSPDGRSLVFTRVPPTDQTDIGLFDLKTGRVAMIIASHAPEQHPRFSPDGRWLAYSSSETGNVEVFVASLDGKTKRQISDDGGAAPVWRPDGRVLYYRKAIRTLVARDVSGFPATIGKPTVLVKDGNLAQGFGYGHPGFDAAADRRLLLVLAGADETALRFEIVINWLEELKQRARAGK
jgi:serine/threonine-protein kinase